LPRQGDGKHAALAVFHRAMPRALVLTAGVLGMILLRGTVPGPSAA
jgi:hypothetical protein